MVWIRKADPYEPVVARVERVEERDRAVSDPIGVVVLARHRIGRDLLESGVTAAVAVQRSVLEQRVEPADVFGMLCAEPCAVVPERERAVHRELHVLEAAMRSV